MDIRDVDPWFGGTKIKESFLFSSGASLVEIGKLTIVELLVGF
jgi:hypothetical protein